MRAQLRPLPFDSAQGAVDPAQGVSSLSEAEGRIYIMKRKFIMSAFVYLDNNGNSTSNDDEAFITECQRQWANPLPQWNIFTPPVLKKLAQAL